MPKGTEVLITQDEIVSKIYLLRGGVPNIWHQTGTTLLGISKNVRYDAMFYKELLPWVKLFRCQNQEDYSMSKFDWRN